MRGLLRIGRASPFLSSPSRVPAIVTAAAARIVTEPNGTRGPSFPSAIVVSSLPRLDRASCSFQSSSDVSYTDSSILPLHSGGPVTRSPQIAPPHRVSRPRLHLHPFIGSFRPFPSPGPVAACPLGTHDFAFSDGRLSTCATMVNGGPAYQYAPTGYQWELPVKHAQHHSSSSSALSDGLPVTPPVAWAQPHFPDGKRGESSRPRVEMGGVAVATSTPLADYASEMFWFIWVGSSTSPDSPDSLRSIVADLPATSSLRDTHAFHVPDLFRGFVKHVLTSTQVSHSCAVLALQYASKYKRTLLAVGDRTPERLAFITSLMLANKYLDDNTYTNATWAQFLALPVRDVNACEIRWLTAFGFDLSVKIEAYNNWAHMLEVFIDTRLSKDQQHKREVARRLASYHYTASAAYNFVAPTAAYLRSTASPRARSVSPPTSSIAYFAPYSLTPDATTRKRSAGAAFEDAWAYASGPASASPAHQSGDSLRPMAGLPGRRGSAGQLVHHGEAEPDLRHAATNLAAARAVDPYKYPQAYLPEPKHKVFLQAAATPLYGPDNRYHKAVPHYADPYAHAYPHAVGQPCYAAPPPPMVVTSSAYSMAPSSGYTSPVAHARLAYDLGYTRVPSVSPTKPASYGTLPGAPAIYPVAPSYVYPEYNTAPFADAGLPGYRYREYDYAPVSATWMPMAGTASLAPSPLAYGRY
ncbi:hypothetical protein Q5752_006533 [Cryptotrichosporon argae]